MTDEKLLKYDKQFLEEVLKKKEIRLGNHPEVDFLKHILKNGTLEPISKKEIEKLYEYFLWENF